MNAISGSLADPAATDAFAARLADALPATAGANVVIHLIGELGAGKSSFARAMLRRIGVSGAIRSPTYTLVERYPTAVGECLHLDLYRLADAGELDFLGLDELMTEARLWLVEWPERGGAALPACDLRLRLAYAGSGRRFELEAFSPRSAAWIQVLRDPPVVA